MRRKALVAGVVLFAFAVGAVGFAGASASPNGDERRKLNLTEPYDQFTEVYTDLGEPGVSSGDIDTFYGEVYDATGKVHLGYETSQCVIGAVKEDRYTFSCSADFVLTDGQIVTEGTLENPLILRGPGLSWRNSPALPIHFAITGGTDRFLGARGQLNWGGGANGFLLSFLLLGEDDL